MEFVSNLTMVVDTANDMPTWLVCVLGVSVVFVGLIAIIAILYLMNYLIGLSKKNDKATTTSVATATSTATPVAAIENRREIIAAVCAAVAEEEGTDISAIRVISFKKL